MRFIVDAQLPPALAQALRSAGCDVAAVRDIGLREARDPVLWKYALQHQAAIITKDEDFVDRSLQSENPPHVIWLRVGNTSNRALLAWLMPLWPEIMRRVTLGERLIEVR